MSKLTTELIRREGSTCASNVPRKYSLSSSKYVDEGLLDVQKCVDRWCSGITPKRPRNDYSIPDEESFSGRIITAVYCRHHQVDDKELRVDKDDDEHRYALRQRWLMKSHEITHWLGLVESERKVYI